MKLSIFENKEKFVALFGILKNASSIINIYINNEILHLQGMDKSHVCLYDCTINKDWFDTFEKDTQEMETICFDTHTFYSIINSCHTNQIINIHYSKSADTIHIDLMNNEKDEKREFNKYFKIPLVNYDHELIKIPTVEYEAEIKINSKKIYDIISQMSSFGNDVQILCLDDAIELVTEGMNGEMMVKIPMDDLIEFAICEGENINILYSLNYIHKMCVSTKLSNEIEFFISVDSPMKIKYDLGKNSYLLFFIAPKISEKD